MTKIGAMLLIAAVAGGVWYWDTAEQSDATKAKATAERAVQERLAQGKTAQSSNSLPAPWVASATKLDGKWTGSALVSAGLNCLRGFYTIAIRNGTVDGAVNWQGLAAGISNVTGYVEDDSIASIVLQSPSARSSYFVLRLQNGHLVGQDAGPCSYDVSLSRG